MVLRTDHVQVVFTRDHVQVVFVDHARVKKITVLFVQQKEGQREIKRRNNVMIKNIREPTVIIII